MVKKINIEITFNKRSIYTLIFIAISIIIGIGVYADEISDPTILGHNVSEIRCDTHFCATNEKIGIGTTTPTAKLEVNGNIKTNELCLGNDCRDSWQNCSNPNNTEKYYSNGLYGFCMMKYTWKDYVGGSFQSSQCSGASAPAFCSTYCGCSEGYSRLSLTPGLGIPNTKTTNYYLFVCQKI